MLIKRPDSIKSSEITDEKLYLARRTFMRGAVLAATTVATGALYRTLLAPNPKTVAEGQSAESAPDQSSLAGENLTPYEDITNYNNFYEFSTDKSAVAQKAKNFVTRPWTVAVEGFVHKPGVYDIDDLLKANPQEERVYRLRCVEGWSM
nr:mononuclear molybdenum enzyme YedY [Pyrinomonadaceae bacterium]